MSTLRARSPKSGTPKEIIDVNNEQELEEDQDTGRRSPPRTVNLKYPSEEKRRVTPTVAILIAIIVALIIFAVAAIAIMIEERARLGVLQAMEDKINRQKNVIRELY